MHTHSLLQMPQLIQASARIAACFATVSKTTQIHPGSLRHIHNPLHARNLLKLSLSEMGRALGAAHPNGHAGRNYARCSVWHFEHGRALTDDVRESYRRIIEAALQNTSPTPLTIKAQYYKHKWKFDILKTCATCQHTFLPSRSTQRKCKQCRK